MYMFGKKVAVVYFSRLGTTKEIAQAFPLEEGDKIYEIKPVQEYPSSFFKAMAASKVENKTGEFPEIIKDDIDLSKYDNILIGFPIWYATAPRIIFSFLRENDMSEKTLFPFCTSHLAGVEQATADIREFYKKQNVNVKDGKRFKKYSEQEIKELLDF